MANYMHRTKRSRIVNAEAAIQHVLNRLYRSKRKPQWVMAQLVHARDQLGVVLAGKIR